MQTNSKYPIRYSQCWEDTELLLEALAVQQTDTVLSIASGGCNSLALLSCHPEKLVILDRNPYQVYLAELKYYSLIELADDAEAFLGLGATKKRESYYKTIAGKLSESSRIFWKSHPSYVLQGVIHAGKFEKYLNVFRKYLLPLVHTQKIRSHLLGIDNPEEQKLFYDEVWNNWRWRLLFRIFFSESLMRRFGRSAEMFLMNQQLQTGTIYFNRTEKAFREGNLNRNRYLEYIFTGTQLKNKPFYILPNTIESIKKAKPPVFFIESLFEFLKMQEENSIDKFNLSDVFEVHTEEETTQIFKEVVRVSRDNARLIFWNNLVPRGIPENLKVHFISETTLVDQLIKRDKIFFYESFKIYRVSKKIT